jgi:hypothetical protein
LSAQQVITDPFAGQAAARHFLSQLDDPRGYYRANPRTWIEANLVIRTKGRREIPFLLNAVQQRFLAQMTGRDLILKPRQLGFTTLSCALFFADTLLRPNTTSVLVAHDWASTEKIFRIVHLFWEQLPEEERVQVGRPRYASKTELVWPQIGSSFYVGAAGSARFGHGLTIHNLHLSEAARYVHPEVVLRGLLEAVPLGGRIIFESTANGMGNDFHQRWVEAKGGKSTYRPHLYLWWDDPSYRIEGPPLEDVTEEERALMARHGLDDAQIRWRRGKIAELGRAFPEQYPEDDESCFLTTGRMFFDLQQADLCRMGAAADPIGTEDNGDTVIWQEPTPGRAYIIAADTAKGKEEAEPTGLGDEVGGPDYSAAVVRDWVSGEHMASVHTRLPEYPFAHLLLRLWRRYPGLIVAERPGPGEVVALRLHELEPRAVWVERKDKRPGWLSNAQTRRLALDRLWHGIEKLELGSHDEGFWSEVRAFAYQDDGIPRAQEGRHDDRVMCWAISELVRLANPAPEVRGGKPKPLPQYGHTWDRGPRVGAVVAGRRR